MVIVISSLLLPLIMIVTGSMMKSGWPKKPNWVAGYRTLISMKNPDTWDFAHRHFGKFGVVFGAIAILPSAVLGVNVDTGVWPIWALIALFVTQFVVIILGIILTEIALRKEFDKNGEHR